MGGRSVIGPAAVRRTASATGFREDAVEKVLYLTAILARFGVHPDLRNAWVLKGGTALNLFHLDVPRLSVDIDVNYIGAADLAAMQSARPAFERAVAACCEREGCQVRRAPGEHAGGKYRLRYTGGASGPGSLEVDVNYVQWVPLFGLEKRRPRFPPKAENDGVPVLSVEELAAGKFAALLTRAAPRDAFDAWQLLQTVPDLLGRPTLRVAFVVQAGSVREDLRAASLDVSPVAAKAVRDELLPLLRAGVRPAGEDPEHLADTLTQVRQEVTSTLLRWRREEREFLNRLMDRGATTWRCRRRRSSRRSIASCAGGRGTSISSTARGTSAPSGGSSRTGSARTCGASTGTTRAPTRPFRTPCSTAGWGSTGCRRGRPGPLRRMPGGEGDRRAGCGQTARPVR
jgi:predicted nucleotidyltransferase component of viral defense system